ncbi:endonuclease III domain-containing protein [bacterium]|nr:MAG: endonuclease III domain-containing protein [bacterium]
MRRTLNTILSRSTIAPLSAGRISCGRSSIPPLESRAKARILGSIFRRLYSKFGPQHWWPADSNFEVIVGAILTQNTSWQNAEKAISRLKEKKLLEPKRLYQVAPRKLAVLIKSAGYYNIKTRRLKEFLKFFFEAYQGRIKKMSQEDHGLLRKLLLSVNGIGPETADSILLYALGKPVFVVDAYTKRILSRHKLISPQADYANVQDLFTRHLLHDTKMFNEYHALLVKLGKDFCLKSKPRCHVCPLKDLNG